MLNHFFGFGLHEDACNTFYESLKRQFSAFANFIACLSSVSKDKRHKARFIATLMKNTLDIFFTAPIYMVLHVKLHILTCTQVLAEIVQ